MAKASKSNKYVYTWGNKKADGDGSMKPLLGGKGANLAEMTRIGLPVPPGFTITTEVCTYFYAHKKTYPKELQGQMEAGVKTIVWNTSDQNIGQIPSGIYFYRLSAKGLRSAEEFGQVMKMTLIK